MLLCSRKLIRESPDALGFGAPTETSEETTVLPNPDPRLIKAQIEGVKSSIEELSRAANKELVLVENHEVVARS